MFDYIAENTAFILVVLALTVVGGAFSLWTMFQIEQVIIPRFIPLLYNKNTLDQKFVRYFFRPFHFFYINNLRMTAVSTAVATLILSVFLIGIIGHFLLQHAEAPWCLPLFMLSGFVLYGLRSRFPFIYGSLELSVGMSSIWYSSNITASANSDLARLLAISSGVYIMVRGLDNMSKRLPKRLKPYWPFLMWDRSCIPKRLRKK